LPGNEQADRFTSGLFASLQAKLGERLRLSGGLRGQFYAGNRALDPVLLLEGAGVLRVLENVNLKLNFAEGFRPPALLKTATVPTNAQVSGNRDLLVERSRAIQSEINAGWQFASGPLRAVRIRADYAYTWVQDFIAIRNARFENTGDIGISTVEILARLALDGGHRISIGYTLNDTTSTEDGVLRSLPASWLTVEARFNLWRKRLILGTDVTYFGSFEDPNQRAVVPAGTIRLGNVDASGQPLEEALSIARWSDRVFDRVGANVMWNAVLSFAFTRTLRGSLAVYNILDARSYWGESYQDLGALLEPVASPWRGTSFIFSLNLRS
jgi:hypothetical protein